MTRRMRRPPIETALHYDADGTWFFRIGLELKSPNKTLWHHWRTKHRERQLWEGAIRAAIARFNHLAEALVLVPTPRTAPAGRVRVATTRLVPSTRHYIRDDDNLIFAMKPVLDALKRVGVIADDNRKQLDLRAPVQQVSEDRKFWTNILVERLAGQEQQAG